MTCHCCKAGFRTIYHVTNTYPCAVDHWLSGIRERGKDERVAPMKSDDLRGRFDRED